MVAVQFSTICDSCAALDFGVSEAISPNESKGVVGPCRDRAMPCGSFRCWHPSDLGNSASAFSLSLSARRRREVMRLKFVSPRKATDRKQDYTKRENQPTLVWKNEPIPQATVTKVLKDFRSSREFVEHRGAR